jgi:(S)-2-hydroxyglutarate dehydrogenase
MLSKSELRSQEPNCAGVAALFCPTTGIVDYSAVTRALADELKQCGGEVFTNSEVLALRDEPGCVKLSIKVALSRGFSGASLQLLLSLAVRF